MKELRTRSLVTGEHVQVSVSAQLHLAVRKVVCVEDDMFGEEAGPHPRHPGPHHPAPVIAHKVDLMTEAVNAELLHQEDHALQVQVRSRSNTLALSPRICHLRLGTITILETEIEIMEERPPRL